MEGCFVTSNACDIVVQRKWGDPCDQINGFRPSIVSEHRAGEMIREVGRTKPRGPSRKRVPKCPKGPDTIFATILIAGKQSKRSKKGPFCYILGPPGSHPGNGINGARRGRSLPVPPPPVSPAMSKQQHWRDNAHSVFVLDNDLHSARLCCT